MITKQALLDQIDRKKMKDAAESAKKTGQKMTKVFRDASSGLFSSHGIRKSTVKIKDKR